MNVAWPILDILAHTPERLAVEEPSGRRIAYGALRALVVGLARRLKREGFKPGERAVLQVPNGVDFAISALAVLLAGGVPVLVEPGLGDAVYQSRIQAAAPRWLLVHPRVVQVGRVPGLRRWLRRQELDVPPVPSVPRTLVVDEALLTALSQEGAGPFAPVARRPEDDGLLIFTGGTTTAPKGVRLSHAALDHYLSHISGVVADLTIERFLADTPQQLLYALRLGKSAYATKGRKAKRADSVFRRVMSGDVDAYFGSPYIWVEMARRHRAQVPTLPATLKTVLLGSAPVTPTFLAELKGWLHPSTRVAMLYGLTEAGPVCVAEVADKLCFAEGGDLVGVPVPGVTVTVDAPEGEVGEVLVASPSLYTGYLGEPPRQGALKTGDLGRFVETPTGRQLVLMGRAKDMIIRRGVNLYPGTLEPTLKALSDAQGPLLADAALVGLYDEALADERLILCAVPTGRGPAPALLARAADALGPDGAPDAVVWLPALPVTGRQNKLDRAALRAQAKALLHRPVSDPLPGARLPFDFKALAKKYALLWQAERAPKAVLGQLSFRLGLYTVAQATWALDELIAPEWRKTEGRGPLFILGHQRSGTTFLHRLLAEDETHARALALHEMLLPALTAQRALSALGKLDRRLGGHLQAALDRIETRLFAPLDDIHRLRFSEIEEDEFVLWGIFSSIMCANDAPSAAALPGLDDLRDFTSWDEARKRRTLGYYRACLMKKLAQEPGAERRWVVSKNPAFSHKIPELSALFPDGRFVYLVRNPLETIPSRLSLIRAIWRRRFPGFEQMTPTQVETILADSVRNYLAAERDLAALPPDRRLVLPYETLLASPQAAVESIYRTFGLPGPDARLKATLAHLSGKPGPHRTRHQYALAEFGLSEPQLRERLKPVFETYGY